MNQSVDEKRADQMVALIPQEIEELPPLLSRHLRVGRGQSVLVRKLHRQFENMSRRSPRNPGQELNVEIARFHAVYYSLLQGLCNRGRRFLKLYWNLKPIERG